MHSVKLPFRTVWRLFDVHVDGGRVWFHWPHAGIANLTPAERYILDVAAGPTWLNTPQRAWWDIDEGDMAHVSELLVDAQEDADEAVMIAWLRFDPSLRAPTSTELATRFHRPSSLAGPHRKGAEDAK